MERFAKNATQFVEWFAKNATQFVERFAKCDANQDELFPFMYTHFMDRKTLDKFNDKLDIFFILRCFHRVQVNTIFTLLKSVYCVFGFQDEFFTVLDNLFLSPEEVCGLVFGPTCSTFYWPLLHWNVTFPSSVKPPVRPHVLPTVIACYAHLYTNIKVCHVICCLP